MVAGVMYILALLIGLWQMVTFISAYQLMAAGGAIAGEMTGMNPMAIFNGIILIMLVVSILGVVGSLLAAVFCFLRKQFPLALIGGILSFVGLHFLFGLIGFIMMMGSKDQFAK